MKSFINISQHIIKKMLVIAAFLIPALAFSQPKNSRAIKYTVVGNNFNGINLGADINQAFPAYKLTYLDGDNKFDTDSCLKFACTDTSILKVNADLSLDLVGLRTFNGKIVNIYLFFNRNDGYKVLNNFLTRFGVFTSRPNNYADVYNWDSAQVSLSLEYQADADLGVAIFTDKRLLQDIYAMKEAQKFKKDYEKYAAQSEGSETAFW